MKEKKNDINLILLLFPVLIILGKVIRWTILKSVLVDMSIGNSMINIILHSTRGFTSFAETGVSDAAGNAAVFFRIFNIFNLTNTKQFEIYISVIWNLILLLIIIKNSDIILTDIQLFFLSISIIVLNIWDFCLAKEPLQFTFFLVIYLILKKNNLTYIKKYIYILLTLFISILYYRVYYVLIVAFLIIITILCEKYLKSKEKITKNEVFKLLLLLVSIYFVMLISIKLIDKDSFNELIRVRTRSGKAHTQMINIFKSSNIFIFCIDYLIMIIRMLIPVELIPMSIKYWPYVFYQILITYFIVKSIINIKSNTKEENLSLYIYLAFLLGSAAFEPDFGSWVRHEATVFPILLIITKTIKIQEGVILNEENNISNNG